MKLNANHREIPEDCETRHYGSNIYILNNFKIIWFVFTVEQNEKDTALVHNSMVRAAVLPYPEIWLLFDLENVGKRLQRSAMPEF